MADLTSKWNTEEFHFTGWRDRGVHILMGVTLMLEDLEEAQLNLQTMLTMRHVEPFRPKARKLLEQLSNGSESLELWSKVQTLWCSLESVFLGGDIARQVRVGSRTARRGYHSCVMFCCATQMPVVARRFAKIDKDWVRVMAKAYNTGLVVEATSNELLRASLPVMFNELEKCQKNLDSYLEQKRSIFPRFYFVSDPVLLQILSQGSDPQAVQPFYEKIFESITAVEHDDSDNTIIRVRVCARLNVWVCVVGGGRAYGCGSSARVADVQRCVTGIHQQGQRRRGAHRVLKARPRDGQHRRVADAAASGNAAHNEVAVRRVRLRRAGAGVTGFACTLLTEAGS